MKDSVVIQNLNMGYSGKKTLFREFSLSFAKNEITCILGPSGAGKTTLLHLLAGFIRPDSGHLQVPPACGMVFQKHNLFPWKTILQNVTLGPLIRGEPRADTMARAQKLLFETGLADTADRFPFELSFGMQQRVGIVRAFANNPELLLMDEPFGALDAQTRLRMQQLLLNIWEKDSKTVIFVTHDIEEAIFLSHRILVFKETPVSLAADIRNPLPHPRSYSQILDPAAMALRKEIFNLLL